MRLGWRNLKAKHVHRLNVPTIHMHIQYIVSAFSAVMKIACPMSCNIFWEWTRLWQEDCRGKCSTLVQWLSLQQKCDLTLPYTSLNFTDKITPSSEWMAGGYFSDTDLVVTILTCCAIFSWHSLQRITFPHYIHVHVHFKKPLYSPEYMDRLLIIDAKSTSVCTCILSVNNVRYTKDESHRHLPFHYQWSCILKETALFEIEV